MDAVPIEVVVQIFIEATTGAWHDRATIHALRSSCKCIRNTFDSTNRRLTLGWRKSYPKWEKGTFIPQIPALLSRTLNLRELNVSILREIIINKLLASAGRARRGSVSKCHVSHTRSPAPNSMTFRSAAGSGMTSL